MRITPKVFAICHCEKISIETCVHYRLILTCMALTMTLGKKVIGYLRMLNKARATNALLAVNSFPVKT